MISSYPVYTSVVREEPRQTCHIEQVAHRDAGRNSATPAILGTIIGGALGNAVGSKKSNKRVGAVVGGVLGYSVGKDIGRRHADAHADARYESREVCSTVYERVEEERLTGYDVEYAYAGQTYKTRMLGPGRNNSSASSGETDLALQSKVRNANGTAIGKPRQTRERWWHASKRSFAGARRVFCCCANDGGSGSGAGPRNQAPSDANALMLPNRPAGRFVNLNQAIRIAQEENGGQILSAKSVRAADGSQRHRIRVLVDGQRATTMEVDQRGRVLRRR